MPKKKKSSVTTDKTPEQMLIEKLQEQIAELEGKVTSLENDKKDQEETVKRAQYDYINLKMDFDRYKKQQESLSSQLQTDLQIQAVKKFLPFVETMRKSLDTLDEKQKKSKLAEGVALMYKNFLSTLESMNIKPIKALGLDPDTNLHEPVGTQEVDDENLKGKIIQELERGFVLTKDGKQTVITTSKVVIGQ